MSASRILPLLELLVQRHKQPVRLVAIQMQRIISKIHGQLIVGNQIDTAIAHHKERVLTEVKLR